MGNFFGDELHEVGDELVEAGIVTQGGEAGGAVFGLGGFGGGGEDGAADFLEVELEFFGENVFDLGAGSGRRGVGKGGEAGVRGIFWEEVEGARVACAGVLGDGRLDAFDGEPVGWRGERVSGL